MENGLNLGNTSVTVNGLEVVINSAEKLVEDKPSSLSPCLFPPSPVPWELWLFSLPSAWDVAHSH